MSKSENKISFCGLLPNVRLHILPGAVSEKKKSLNHNEFPFVKLINTH